MKHILEGHVVRKEGQNKQSRSKIMSLIKLTLFTSGIHVHHISIFVQTLTPKLNPSPLLSTHLPLSHPPADTELVHSAQCTV